MLGHHIYAGTQEQESLWNKQVCILQIHVKFKDVYSDVHNKNNFHGCRCIK